MGQPAARVTDMHVCPMVTGVVPHVGGPILPAGCPTVLTGSLPQARITDMLFCAGGPDMIALGAFTVLVGSLPAARMGDMTMHGGSIILGFPTVLIGDAGAGGGGGGGVGDMINMALNGGAGSLIGSVLAPNLEITTAAAMQQPDAQAATLKQAAKDGSGFCELCNQ